MAYQEANSDKLWVFTYMYVCIPGQLLKIDMLMENNLGANKKNVFTE